MNKLEEKIKQAISLGSEHYEYEYQQATDEATASCTNITIEAMKGYNSWFMEMCMKDGDMVSKMSDDDLINEYIKTL